MNSYNHTDIEAKWAAFWQENQIYQTPRIQAGDRKKYILDMFPYPSAAGLHIGHPRGYTATDILSRFYRAQGYKVLHPMGWDAFGLPAEQHAVKTGVHPKLNTQNNVANFRLQLQKMGFSYDWSQEVDTTDPNYYKWTQWIFIKLFERGLAFEQETAVNWCPALATILANEEIVGGVSERGGHPVFRLPIKQWLLKITEYAQRLNSDLEKLPNWPKKIKLMQQNWIGQSSGFEVDFEIYQNLTSNPELNSKNKIANFVVEKQLNSVNLSQKETLEKEFVSKNVELEIQTNQNLTDSTKSNDARASSNLEKQSNDSLTHKVQENFKNDSQSAAKITVYTTRLDTIFGVTFLVISPEHPILATITSEEQKAVVENYCQKALAKSDLERTDLNKDKEGVWTGSFAINPINQAKIPIWVADYVLMSYGTGAIMAVPAHDQRDFDFAQKFDLPIVPVITSKIDFENEKLAEENSREQEIGENLTQSFATNFKTQPPFLADDGLTINSGQFSGLEKTEAIAQISQKLTSLDKARQKTNYKLRDWIFSRQRFWGEPIPIVFEVNDMGQKISGPIAVHESDLPVLLPEIDDFDRIKPDTTKNFPEAALARFPEWFQVQGYLLDGKFKAVPSSVSPESANNQSSNNRVSNNPFLKDSLAKQHVWSETTGSNLKDLGDFSQNKNEVNSEKDGANLPPHLGGEQNEGVVLSNEMSPVSKNEKPQIRRFVRETNTMPQWAGSSWYWLRFMDPHNPDSFCDLEKAWGPVDIYIGGAEHAVLHLLYARFWHKVLFDLKLVSTEEPFTKLVNQGLILASDGQKISKSLGNGPSPDEIVNQWGADALRLYQMFLGPFEQAVMWNSSAIVGVQRFLEKFWNLQNRLYLGDDKNTQDLNERNIAFGPKTEAVVETALQQLIQKITEDIENCKFNTCVSELMKFVNLVEKTGSLTLPQMLKVTIILAPFAPFICEEIYSELQNLAQNPELKSGAPRNGGGVESGSKVHIFQKSIHLESWPQTDSRQITAKSTIIAVSINGKVRGSLEVNPDLDQTQVQELVLQQEFVQKYTPNGFKKFIYVPGKIVNLVV